MTSDWESCSPNRRQIGTATSFCLFSFLLFLNVYIISPFYALEATSRGVSMDMVGLVFGVYPLVVAIASPIMGKYLSVFNAKNVYNFGIVLNGISTALLGLVDLVTSSTSFVAVSLTLRGVSAIGGCLITTTIFATVSSICEDYTTVLIGVVQLFIGLGSVASSSLGGFMYDQGGFKAPLLGCGALMLLAFPVNLVFLPDEFVTENSDYSGDLLRFLLQPGIVVVGFALLVGCGIVAGYFATAAVYLDVAFDLSASDIGLVLMSLSLVYALAAPVVGLVCAKTGQNRIVLIVGTGCLVISTVFLGPLWFLPIPDTLALTVVSSCLLGFASITIAVPVIQDFVNTSCSNGFPNNFSTNSLASGIFICVISFGEFLGSFLGSFVYERLHFHGSTTFFFVAAVLALIFLVALTVFNYCRKGDDQLENGEYDSIKLDIAIDSVKISTVE